MLALVSLLPVSWQPRAKAIIGAVGVVLAVVVQMVPVLPEWASVAVAALTALGVFATPAPGYVPPAPAQHRAG